MICRECGKEFNLEETLTYFNENFKELEYDEDYPVCGECIPSYIEGLKSKGLDMDYLLVTGKDPSSRPDDWEMHDSDLYVHKTEYFNYLTNV